MSCIICTEESKYRCPTCRQYYCSVKCCQQHKETPCSAPQCEVNEPCVKESNKEYDFPTEDTIPLERLELLEKSTDLQKCLENPHLRSILEKLDESPNPGNEILTTIKISFPPHGLWTKVVQNDELNMLLKFHYLKTKQPV